MSNREAGDPAVYGDLDTGDIAHADTQRPEELAARAPQVPLADAPCDVGHCREPWYERVEWHDAKNHLHVRFVCKEHATKLLMEL
jgi:hypothetical protein